MTGSAVPMRICSCTMFHAGRRLPPRRACTNTVVACDGIAAWVRTGGASGAQAPSAASKHSRTATASSPSSIPASSPATCRRFSARNDTAIPRASSTCRVQRA